LCNTGSFMSNGKRVRDCANKSGAMAMFCDLCGRDWPLVHF